MLVQDRLAPSWVGSVNPRTATPIRALTLTLIACILLLISGQLSLALNVAVFALVVLYFIHSLTFLFLPRLNPKLQREITLNLPDWLQRTAAIVSLISMGVLVVIQLLRDADTLKTLSLSQRIDKQSLTSIELVFVWGLVGAILYGVARIRMARIVKLQGTQNLESDES